MVSAKADPLCFVQGPAHPKSRPTGPELAPQSTLLRFRGFGGASSIGDFVSGPTTVHEAR